MKLRKILGLLVVLALSFGLVTACSEKDGDDGASAGSSIFDLYDIAGGEVPPGFPATGVMADGTVRNLGGVNLDVGIWWVPNNPEPTTEYGRAQIEYRDYVQLRHNFTMQEAQVFGSHGEHADVIAASTLAGNPSAAINKVDPGRIVSLVRNNMFFDVSTLSTDLTAAKWNSHVHGAMHFDGGIFGFVQGYNPWNAGVVFFNKDVLREAGIDPDRPYDLQLANEWTWDAMLEIAMAVTREEGGNTGINNRFGFCLFSNRTMLSALYSNGASFVNKDDTGRFYNAASGSNAFLQAFDFVRSFDVLELMQPQPEGAGWEWWRAGFNEGRAAFLVYEDYGKDDFAEANFDWGMVLFPRGPQMEKIMTVYYENINTIPVTFTKAEADDILFAFDIFTNEPPGYEGDEMAWKYGSYDSYRDPRAVDETLAMIRSGQHSALRLDQFVPGFETGTVTFDVWNLESTGAQLVEEASQEWNSIIATANRSIFGE
jgi:ABC-type glycerol-3-phosphate transport system substrate-binding protein